MLHKLLIFFIILTNEKNIIFGEQNLNWISYCEFKGINNDILTCDKCIFSDNTTQSCSLLNNNNKQIRVNISDVTQTQRTLPYLTNSWFNYDLIYMIQNYEIITNLNNESIINSTFDDVYIENFVKNLKIIELNNWGIEILSKNSFEKFSKLKVLRLNSNSINTIDFSSFLTNETNLNENSNNGIEFLKNQLIELDLSNNKIELIKIENLMYFENLKILNLSRNHIRVIDLKLISLIAPHLQVFDVSFNYIQKFSLLNVNSNNNNRGVQTSATSYFYSIQLIYNYFLKDLIYINLSGNFLSNILDLFSITVNQLESSQEYCNITELNQGYFKRASPIHINIKNNPWKCDCLDLSFLISIIEKTAQQQFNKSESCLTNLIFKKLNLFSINQHHNIELLKNLSCYLKQNETNWSNWYKNKCSMNKLLINDDQNNMNFTSLLVTTTISQPITFVSTIKYSNLATKIYKYDVSSTFYWISSVCVSIVTITCLLIAWFYCWKRYRVSRRVMLEAINSNNSIATNSSPICRNNVDTARCMARRNIYLVNSRFSEEQQHQQNLQTNSQILRGHHRNAHNSGNNRNVTGLYYISLNRESNSSDGYSNYNDIPNSFSLDDEPPNYYEAISKHNIRYSLNKHTNRLSRTSIATNTTTTNVLSNQINIDNPSISVLNINTDENDRNNQSTSTDV